MSEHVPDAPESVRHWSGRDPSDSGYCPECGEHLDSGRCECEEEDELSEEIAASVVKMKLPTTLRYDGMFSEKLVQFTELDRFSPSYGASFYLPVHQLTLQAITWRRAQVRRKFNEALRAEGVFLTRGGSVALTSKREAARC